MINHDSVDKKQNLIIEMLAAVMEQNITLLCCASIETNNSELKDLINLARDNSIKSLETAMVNLKGETK